MDRPKKYAKTLGQCKTKEEREALVAQAMADGHSNTSAAKALRTSPGTIAGIRRVAKIPSKNPPTHGVAIEPARSSPAVSAPKTSASLPEARPRPKLAASEATQCTERINGNPCAFERVPGSTKCPVHQ